jgi:hypothetical protein
VSRWSQALVIEVQAEIHQVEREAWSDLLIEATDEATPARARRIECDSKRRGGRDTLAEKLLQCFPLGKVFADQKITAGKAHALQFVHRKHMDRFGIARMA